ncbi:hypothetical protein [Halorubrum sp. Boch-26]|uniref:hypothetical protein n=1 Tax=Halorubrum sp. Boch-26 TaxID=2994426 RepID=UPI002469081B|nr:hypothetical protein [Halorubrum sp. Boch-26]
MEQKSTDRSLGDEVGHVTRALSRRRLLAAGVPALLAGCLVESDEGANGGSRAGSDADGTGSEPGESAGGDGSTDGSGDASAGDSTAEQADDEQADDGQADEPAPDAVGPDAAGLVVTNTEVLGVTDDGYETTVDARLTVENAGRFTYGTVELRVDAYATRPSSSERDPVGFAYVTERFSSGNRFSDGTRRFDVSISFRSRETNARPDPGWYEVDAAVRTSNPI